jgi:hypothetical protein
MRLRLLTTALIASYTALCGSSVERARSTAFVQDRHTTPTLRSDVGVIRTGSGNWTTLSHVNRYGIIIASSANATYAARQPGRALTWGCGVTIYTNDIWNRSLRTSCGVPWEQAVANDWILKDAGGNYVRYGDCSSGLALLDVGNSAYEKAFTSRVEQILASRRGLDGVFIDDVEGSALGRCTKSVKYPNDASYRRAILSFVKAVGSALRAKGWYVAVNAAIDSPAAEPSTGPSWDGTQYIWWARQLAPYVDGINMERWQENWDASASIRVRGQLGNQAWDGWERVPAALASLGKDFFAMETGGLADVNKASYLRASFLLAWKPGRGAFLYTDDYAGRGDPWTLTATPQIGRPLGPKVGVGTGFRRTFSSGVVVINPDPSEAQIFVFRRRYLLPDGTATKSVVVPPGSALVLRRATGH